MKGIIIPFTEEEFEERMDAALQRAFGKYLQKKEDIEYLIAELEQIHCNPYKMTESLFFS